jgi:hypothetical protein
MRFLRNPFGSPSARDPDGPPNAPSEDARRLYEALTEENLNPNNRVRDRHTRHYYKAKQEFSEAEWEWLKTRAEQELGIDLEEVAERGKEHSPHDS